jgi:hypothetical protein
VPTAPVAPRGASALTVYALLAVLSVLVAGGGLAGMLKVRERFWGRR